MDRFMDLTGKLLSISHDEIMQKEKEIRQAKKKKVPDQS